METFFAYRLYPDGTVVHEDNFSECDDRYDDYLTFLSSWDQEDLENYYHVHGNVDMAIYDPSYKAQKARKELKKKKHQSN